MASSTIDVAFPDELSAAEIEWTLERNVTVASSPYNRTIQEQERAGDRWRCTLRFPTEWGAGAAALTSWLDLISKGGYRGLVPVLQNDMRGTESGSAAFAEMNDSLASWTPLGGSMVVKSVDDGILLWALNNRTDAYGYRLGRTFGVQEGMYHLLSVDVPPLQAFGWRWAGNANAGGVSFDSGFRTDTGRFQQVIYSAGNQFAVGVYAGPGTSDYVWTRYGALRLSRIFTARDVASAGAKSITIQGGDQSNSLGIPAFRRGQFFSILTSWGWELKRATSSPIMISGISVNGATVTHAGDLCFEPRLRGSVAANAPIRHINPYARMMLPDRKSSARIEGALQYGITIDLVEDVT